MMHGQKSIKRFQYTCGQCDVREVLEVYQAMAVLQERDNWTVMEQQKGELTRCLMKVAGGKRRDQNYTNTQTNKITVDCRR
jgi:hypothetical protein